MNKKLAAIYAQDAGGYEVWEVAPADKRLCWFADWNSAIDWLKSNGYEWDNDPGF